MSGPFFSACGERRSSAGKDWRMFFILQAALYVARCVFVMLLAPASDNP
jgi:hypothetical protein